MSYEYDEQGRLKVNTESNPLVTLIDENTLPGKTFVGKAQNSEEDEPVWQIKCIDETTDVVKFLYADGVKTFTKIWADRDQYEY